MPWKGLRDPYLIWLSEIILQQTRVEQGWGYFERFRDRFPTVMDLAAASEDEVLKLWEGLGYYSRARNLHASAQWVAANYGNGFPNTYETILALKGVGPYTAAAIASFAYDLPHAVLDGNVFRVLARYTNGDLPIDSTAGKRYFAELAQQALDVTQPARYNQAIMDFGATICSPGQPDCGRCPLQEHCQALAAGTITTRPVKEKRTKKRHRYLHYLVIEGPDGIILHRRTAKDIWQHLYEFVGIETTGLDVKWEDLIQETNWPHWLSSKKLLLQQRSKPFRQTLSHQYVNATFWEIRSTEPVAVPEGYQKVAAENIRSFAFPKLIDWYLNDKSLYLNLL